MEFTIQGDLFVCVQMSTMLTSSCPSSTPPWFCPSERLWRKWRTQGSWAPRPPFPVHNWETTPLCRSFHSYGLSATIPSHASVKQIHLYYSKDSVLVQVVQSVVCVLKYSTAYVAHVCQVPSSLLIEHAVHAAVWGVWMSLSQKAFEEISTECTTMSIAGGNQSLHQSQELRDFCW